MYELVWLGMLGLATTFSALQLFAHKGGVAGSLASIIAWVTLYFGSSNVTATTSAGLVATNNPTVVWFAVFMAAVHALVLVFVLLGVGQWSETSESEGVASVAGSMSDRI